MVWSWNSFKQLDVTRRAILNEVCSRPETGCPTLNNPVPSNDWLHSNTITYSPADGNLLISLRIQDWVFRVDYPDGAGAGRVNLAVGPSGRFHAQ